MADGGTPISVRALDGSSATDETKGSYLSDIKTPAFAQSAFSMSAKMT
jgi:hypothetical protein